MKTVLCMLHDDYSHQQLDWTLALVRERFYWGTMEPRYNQLCHQLSLVPCHKGSLHSSAYTTGGPCCQ